jgi:hypothetical protein
MRERMLWVGIGVLSLLLAAALGLATSRLTEAPVGLTAEPVSADEALAPTATATPTPAATATPTPKPRKRRKPKPTPTPTAAPTAVPTAAPVSPSSDDGDGFDDDNSGHGSDDSGGEDNSGHGRSGDDD